MKIEELGKYKKVLILRYGIEGRSVEVFLKKNFPDMELGLGEEKNEAEHLSRQTDYELVIKTPGVNKRVIKIPYTTPTNIFFANAKAPIIGITGTKGKSTTTTLVYEMLKSGGYDAHLLGNIGKSMIDALHLPVTDKTVYVLELSSFQLDDLERSPHKALFINIFPEHMDFHGSLEAYKEAKKNIARFSGKDDHFIYNPKFVELEEFSKTIKAQPVRIIEHLPFHPETVLRGEHNIENIKAAYTVAKLMGVSDKDIAKAIKDFKPLPHRLEFVGNFPSTSLGTGPSTSLGTGPSKKLGTGPSTSLGTGKGIDFYDDAISTTPESTIMAINSIPNIQTIFLGGKDRGYEFSSLAQKLVSSEVRNIVLFPESGSKIKNELIKAGWKFKFFETSDMKEAVKFAYENTEEGMACVLSTASPSYSVWKNFEEKGDLFKKFVRELAG